MYSPRRPSFIIPILGILLFFLGILFLHFSAPGMSIFSLAMTEGEVLTYSRTPEVRYSYLGKTYTSTRQGSMSCDDRPCYEIGERIPIIFDTRNPDAFITRIELFVLSLFGLIGLIMIALGSISSIKGSKKRKIILSMIERGSYTDAVVVDMETLESRSKNTRSIKIRYIYICQDIHSGELYRSDLLTEPVFEIGSAVKVYIDPENHPGIYWVDLNTVSESSIGKEKSTRYHEEKISNEKDKLRKLMYSALGYKKSLFLLSGIGSIIVLVGIWIGFFGIILLGTIIIFLGGSKIPSYIHETQREKIRKKNISTLVSLLGVEKSGNWKIVPLGYIPPEEKIDESIDVITINDGIKPTRSNYMGYRYYFTFMNKGEVVKTEVQDKPFPKKYSPGAEARIYFENADRIGKFTIDLESIDELN